MVIPTGVRKIVNDGGRERLIFALDVTDDMAAAMKWVDRLKNHVGLFKIGKEAFTRFGPAVVQAVLERGGRVFLDLKYHDIPNTVARAAENAVALDVSMLNVHAAGGRRMMTEAMEAVRTRAARLDRPVPIVLAVTVLTSLDDDDVAEVGFSLPAGDLAVRLAVLARDAGLSGVVASPREILPIREACGDSFVIVTPGIRYDASGADDQKRTLAPKEAVRRGADYIVVGRPIRTAPDPLAVAEAIGEEISAGLALRE
ncbi:MAG: orotidine-5'-phosphate decarboxylase [Deltaproteobacteria bacterium]|nr:orotidine-5'-phosphate decarboxylase [Deltaproteobacteria bacterium]